MPKCLSFQSLQRLTEIFDPGRPDALTVPAAMLFISRNTCGDSIAKLFRAVFFFGGGGIAHLSRDMLQNGVSHRCAAVCLCETKYQGRGIAPFWGSANLPQRVSRDMGYRSDSIAVLRDTGPLS